jgi:glycosyltransferase involved in cell wall biosynthesis
MELQTQNQLVSVIIRTKDRPELFLNALKSIAAQTYRPVEAVVVNDGGCDLDTEEMVSILGDVSLNYVRLEDNRGRASAGNIGIENARGKYIGFLDDDDELYPHHISTLVSFLRGNSYRIAYADSEIIRKEFNAETAVMVEKERKVFSSYDFSYHDLVVGNYITLISILFSQDVLKEAGGFDEKFEVYEDWDIILRLGKDYPFYHISEVTSIYNQWNNGLQIAQSKESPQVRTAFSRIMEKHHKKITQEVILNLKQKQESLDNELKALIERHAKLNAELLVKDSAVRKNEAELHQNELHISSLMDENMTLRSEINEINASLGWKLLTKLRIVREKLFPPGTGRRKVYQRAIDLLKKRGVKGAFLRLLRELQPIKRHEINQYRDWINENEPTEADLIQQREDGLAFHYRPLVSIVVPVFNTNKEMLISMLESVLAQTYDNWELCVVDGDSNRPYIRDVLRSYQDRDNRIKIRFLPENKHISGNSNEALSFATGEFVGFLDHDDELAPFALFEIIKLLNKNSHLDFIYSDEDKLNEKGERLAPFFKPDWSIELLMSANYITHLSVIRKRIVDEIGGFREGYDGSQDYDLFLRVAARTERIGHVPKILYHWRIHRASAAGNIFAKDYADSAGKKALKDFLKEKDIQAFVESGVGPTTYRVRYLIHGNPLVSIIIPFRDKPELLKKCINSIFKKTSYKHFELILVSNGSTEKSTHKYLETLKHYSNIKLILYDKDFNYSSINNFAVKHAGGKYFLFLNNDTEVISEDWLSAMLEHAQRKEIGAVGCKLLYPDNRVQHAGIVLGMSGFAGHVFSGLHDHATSNYGHLGFVRNFLAVTGACMMVKREVFEEVRGFDERFILCGSDVDFCLKLHKNGYRNVYTPYAVLYHHEALTRGQDVSAIPSSDFVLSMRSYRNYLIEGDPFYNPNLSLMKTDCSLRGAGEDAEVRNIIETHAGIDIDGKALFVTDAQKSVEIMYAWDYSSEDDAANREILSAFERNRNEIQIRSINWFIPHFLHAHYGGIYTIFRFADYFAHEKGIKTRIVLYDHPHSSEDTVRSKIRTAFPNLAEEDVYIYRGPDANAIPYADISIATLWTSAYMLMKFRNTKGKFYFIQDYEPLFYPAGSYYALAEATYRFRFHAIVNTPGLYEFITKQYGLKAEFFIPSVDKSVFYRNEIPSDEAKRPMKLFLYGRPQHDRNAFELALAAAKKIKACFGEGIEIVAAGSDWDTRDYGVNGMITNLGLLGYKETAELYRSCDFGLILMFTKHPSYLPMELMASGTMVITNYNDANTWLLKDRINCILVEPSPTYISEKLVALISDRNLQKSIRDNASRTIAQTDWNREMEKIYTFISGKKQVS